MRIFKFKILAHSLVLLIFRQYLKIWDICKQGTLMTWARRLSSAFSVYTAVYLER
jgi:hypothetical protein